MAKNAQHLLNDLSRLGSSLHAEWGRLGQMERWLEEHTDRLEDLSTRLNATLARIDALVARRSRT